MGSRRAGAAEPGENQHRHALPIHTFWPITHEQRESRFGYAKTPAAAGVLLGGSDRRRSGDLSIFSRTLYQLSYRAEPPTHR